MKVTSEAAKQTAEAITNLTEYTIKHDSEHKEINRRMTEQGKMLAEMNEYVIANSKVSDFWLTLIKYAKYSLIGGLTAVGAYFVKVWFAV